jgi:hypothetical protein
VPAAAGVLQGLVEVDGVRCVHPLQVYLDLAGHPARAAAGRGPEGSARVRDLLLLLEAWREVYDCDGHHIQGQVGALT